MRHLINKLKKWNAHATTLLSLYIPPGRPVPDVINVLRQELSVAGNIKLKQTRNRVQGALQAAIDRLTKIPKVPPNGLVIFSGENDKTGETLTLVIEPPEPVKVFFYRTDKYFHLEFLEDMIAENDVYGLIVIERDEATIGILKGNAIIVLDEIEGYIPGKHSRGGWSQRRYDRIIEELTKDFFKSVGEKATNHFMQYFEEGKLKGILIGGPGYTKLDFAKGDYLEYRLKELVLPKLIDVSDQGEPGLKELVLRAEDLIKEHSYIKTQKALEEFNLHLSKDDGLATYGPKEVEEALKLGAVKYLIIIDEHPELEKFLRLAEDKGAEVYVLNEDLPDYIWVKKTFGGIIAVLRYPIY